MCIVYYNKCLDLGVQKKIISFYFIDGLVEDDGVVEMKCPFGANDFISFEEAVLNKKVNISYNLCIIVTNKATID